MIVIVPYRPDHGHRDRLWAFLRDTYWPGFDVVVGEHSDGPFNRSAAINRAADRDWDIAVIADADTWVPRKQLSHAVWTCRVTGRLTAAFTDVVELTQPTTDDILNKKIGLDDSFGCVRVRRRPLETQSSMLVVSRPLWDAVAGFDEQFVGWAGEDNAFWKACTLHGGEPHRIPGNAYHLWHTPAQRSHPDYDANQTLWRRYQQAHTIKDLTCIRSASSPTPAELSKPAT